MSVRRFLRAALGASEFALFEADNGHAAFAAAAVHPDINFLSATVAPPQSVKAQHFLEGGAPLEADTGLKFEADPQLGKLCGCK
ncbi:response regulator [Geomonas agri]|uniref:hypothetical protein n=1 Tax=Geomonas agri TaxID=2873702 RepID=UPI001CD372BD|nr:hypothetical protein [Geomonas agri]